jgi:2-(1,2-epoxy-1,2-dihydrophenyl)acetyl-CoA isomerase
MVSMDIHQEPSLLIQQRDSALWLTLNRPRKRNALTLELVDSLIDAVTDRPSGVAAIVLAGSPPAFCAGGDIDDLDGVAAGGPIAVVDLVYGRFQRLVSAIASAPVPVIAAVDGPAVGGGFDLALSCDLRVATPAAEFASSWISLGLVPGMGGAHMLTRLIGASRAAEVTLLARRVNASQAEQWGLVNAVVAPANLKSYVTELTDVLGAWSQPALARTKAALRRARDAGLAEELTTLGAMQGVLSGRPEFRAATEPFRRS